MKKSDYELSTLEDISEPELECPKCGEEVDGCDMCGKVSFEGQDEVYCGNCYETDDTFSHICKSCFEKIED